MTRDQEDAAVRRIGDAVHAAIMAELKRGTCPLVILRAFAAQTGALAAGITTGCGASPEAIRGVLAHAIATGGRGPAPAREAKASWN